MILVTPIQDVEQRASGFAARIFSSLNLKYSEKMVFERFLFLLVVFFLCGILVMILTNFPNF